MKKRLLTLSALLVCLNLGAQTYEESMRYWSDGPLEWEELTLKSPKDFRTSSLTFRWISSMEKTRPAWNTVQRVTVPRVALDKSVSWHNAERLYPFTLTYDQVLFDLNELYFRKFLSEFYRKGNEQSSDALYSFYSQQSKKRWEEIFEETRDGIDSTMVAYYAKQISSELDSTSYPDIDKHRKSFLLGFDLGYTCNLFFGEKASTFGAAHGLMLDMNIGYRQHEVGLILAAGTGNLMKDFDNNGTLWKAERKVNHSYISLTYGYVVYDGTFVSLKPFVGIAGRSLIPTKESGKESEKSLVSAVVLAGAEIHFKFYRSLYPTGGLENSMALRAFIARDFGLLKATSLNVGVFYNFSLLSFD